MVRLHVVFVKMATEDDKQELKSFMEGGNNCRFYENKFPNADELVVVQVNSISELGAYVSLLEYDNLEGMILMSELSRRRIRSIHKLIRVGKQETVMVVRVDQEKGYIDLSKRRVTAEELERKDIEYTKAKSVHSVMRQLSETVKIPMIELYEKFCWDLYKRYHHAFEAFRQLAAGDDSVIAKYNLEPAVSATLKKIVAHRMTPQAAKIRADLEITCFSYEGIDAIKEALRAGEALSTEECPIKIKLVAPPLFVMMTQCMNKDEGIKLLEDAVSKITDVIKDKGGEINVKCAPRAVSERDDKLLQSMMETLERQNQEVAGDDEEA